MQLLLSESSEFGKFSGLDLIKGKVENILNQTQKKIKVPHIGWNKISFNGKSEYNIANNKNFYFIHSFISKTEKTNSTIAFTDYNGLKIPAIIKEENIIGFQFHPEKSHYTGLELIKIFNMKKIKLILIGAGQLGVLVSNIIKKDRKYEVVGFIDSTKKKGKKINDIKVLGNDNYLKKLSSKSIQLVICIGDISIRKK